MPDKNQLNTQKFILINACILDTGHLCVQCIDLGGGGG